MTASGKQLLLAIAAIAAGVLAFFLVLAALGIDPDQRPIGLVGWIIGGILIAPGFGLLIRWRRQRDASKQR